MRAHIFVDCENISIEVFKKAYTELKRKYEIVKCDLYGKESCIPKFYDNYTGKIFERHNCFFGKNSADTFMCVDIAKSCYEELLTDCFIIFTQDKDFSIAVKLLVDNHKKVVVVTKMNGLMSNLGAVGVDLKQIENIQVNTKLPSLYGTTCFIKHNNKIEEVPFHNGISLNEFGQVFKDRNLRKYYPSTRKLSKICEDNLLKVVNNRVYFRKEEEYVE